MLSRLFRLAAPQGLKEKREMAERPENSVLFSLKELRRIEDDRVAQEEDVKQTRAAEEMAAREAAEQAAREEAERKAREAEDAAMMAQQQTSQAPPSTVVVWRVKHCVASAICCVVHVTEKLIDLARSLPTTRRGGPRLAPGAAGLVGKLPTDEPLRRAPILFQ